MQTGRSIADKDVPLTLKGQELLERGNKLAKALDELADLEASKAAAAKKWAEKIKACEAEIGRLKRILLDGYENRNQMDLFANQALPPGEINKRLAEIAARAAKHPFVRLDDADPNVCGHEGCTELATADVHVPPVPSEFHTFVADKTGEGKCWGCGSGKDDPIHTDPEQVHAFVLTPGTGPDDGTCVVCEEGPRELIHAHAFVASEGEHPEDCATCHLDADDHLHVVDAHHYSPEAESGDPCGYCGRSGSDSIHIPIDPMTERHTYEEGNETATCLHCGGELDDSKHIGEDEDVDAEAPAATDGQDIAAAAAVAELATFECADCIDSGAALEASTHPKDEGRWIDKDGRQICANCHQVRVEAGTWPHHFEADPAVKTKRGKKPLCKHCELLEGDPVHLVQATAPTEEATIVDTDTTPGDTPPAESVDIAKQHVTAPDPAFDFNESEPRPSVISTHPIDIGGGK